MHNDCQNISYANNLSFNDRINNYSKVKPIFNWTKPPIMNELILELETIIIIIFYQEFLKYKKMLSYKDNNLNNTNNN